MIEEIPLCDITISLDETHHMYKGKPLYEKKFTHVMSFHDPGLAAVLDGDEAYHINISGKPITKRRFQKTFGFYQGLAAVMDESGYYHIRPDGIELYSDRYSWVGNFQEDRCVVMDQNGNYFHITENGYPAYSEKYRYAGDFKYGIAVVHQDSGMARHILNDGSYLNNRQFDELGVFHKGYAIARDAGGYFHINKKGEPLYEQRFEWLEPFYNGQAFGKTHDGSLIVIAENGRIISNVRKNSYEQDRGWLLGKVIGYWDTQILRSLVQLEVLDKIKNGSSSREELEKALGLPIQSTMMIIDLMRIWNLIEEDGNDFRITYRGDMLTEDHPRSMKYPALMWGDEQYTTMQKLTDALITQTPQFEKLYGKDIFQFYSDNPEKGEIFQKALKQYQVDYSDLYDKVDYSSFSTIVDVGGGSGNLLKVILERYPQVEKGIVFDLPGVVDVSKNISNHSKLQFVGGDFFNDKIPQNDCILMSRVLHDWDDSHCIEILKSCNQSLNMNGKLVLYEMIMPNKPMTDMGVRLNFNLLAMVGGRERRLSEFQYLFERTGFLLDKVIAGDGFISIIVAEKENR